MTPETASHDSRRPVSFGLFADVHYGEKVVEGRDFSLSLAKLRACIETFNHEGLAMAVCLGDLIDQGTDIRADRSALAEACRAFSVFRGRKHLVLGNHDLQTLTKSEFLTQCAADVPEPYYSFDRDGVHFIVLDANCHRDGSDFARGAFDWEDAWISESQLAWLADDLQRCRRMPAIVFCHEDLGARARYPVGNAGAARAILQRDRNVRAVFQGHDHIGDYEVLDSIAYVTLAAVADGPGHTDNAYAIASLHADGTLQVRGFGRQPSLRVPAP